MKLDSDSFRDGKPLQARLNEVLERYGLHLKAVKTRPTRDTSPLEQKEFGKENRVAQRAPRAPKKPTAWPRPELPLTGDKVRAEFEPLSCFHFVVRIAECLSVLHCEIWAEHAFEARSRLEQIPNLIEWREITSEELAEMFRRERALNAVRTQGPDAMGESS